VTLTAGVIVLGGVCLNVDKLHLSFLRLSDRFFYCTFVSIEIILNSQKQETMKQKLVDLFYNLLKIAASTEKFGYGFIRVAILVIFVWIGGLKFWNYEAEGIVPFVANSPFMNFFYNNDAPEYKQYKLKEGELDPVKQEWHAANNTYGFSRGLGVLIMSIGILTFLGFFSTKIGIIGEALVIIMTLGTLSFLVTTPECWVPNLGSGEYGFPLLSGAGRLVIKDLTIISGALVLLSKSAKKLLAERV
jgi:reactive chlorine resistance protein C